MAEFYQNGKKFGSKPVAGRYKNLLYTQGQKLWVQG